MYNLINSTKCETKENLYGGLYGVVIIYLVKLINVPHIIFKSTIYPPPKTTAKYYFVTSITCTKV